MTKIVSVDVYNPLEIEKSALSSFDKITQSALSLDTIHTQTQDEQEFNLDEYYEPIKISDKELLVLHGATLPVNHQIEEISPLIKKLHTALLNTRRTVYVSGNKMADFVKTQGWSVESIYQRENGLNTYKKIDKNKWELQTLDDDIFESQPYSITESDPLALLENMNPEMVTTLKKAIILQRERVGNCGDLSCYISAYLWKNAGDTITRIEGIGARDFDHAWVIINRKKGSSLDKPADWGDAWIVDPWWGEKGVFYHASEFSTKILEIYQYCIEQKEFLEKNNYTFSERSELDKSRLLMYQEQYEKGALRVRLNSLFDLSVTKTPYYSVTDDVYKNIEDFYDFSPHHRIVEDHASLMISLSDRVFHENYFASSLNQIKSSEHKGAKQKHPHQYMASEKETANVVFWINLFKAIKQNDKDSISQLLKDKNIENYRNQYGDNVLQFAVRNNHKEIYEFLLPLQKDIEMPDEFSNTLLMRAVLNQNKELVSYLLQKGANANRVDVNGYSALMKISLLNNPDLEIAQLLIANGAKVNSETYVEYETPLTGAVSSNNFEIVKELIQNGADVNVCLDDDFTPLMLSVYTDEVSDDITKLLIDHGADLEAADTDGYSALMYATGLRSKLEILLKAGADANGSYIGDNTALMFLAGREGADPEIAKLLVSYQANVNLKNKEGETALSLAVKVNNIEMVKYLIDAGADIRLKNSLGHSAIDIARELNNQDIIKILSVAQQKQVTKQPLSQAVKSSLKANVVWDKIDRSLAKRLAELKLDPKSKKVLRSLQDAMSNIMFSKLPPEVRMVRLKKVLNQIDMESIPQSTIKKMLENIQKDVTAFYLSSVPNVAATDQLQRRPLPIRQKMIAEPSPLAKHKDNTMQNNWQLIKEMIEQLQKNESIQGFSSRSILKKVDDNVTDLEAKYIKGGKELYHLCFDRLAKDLNEINLGAITDRHVIACIKNIKEVLQKDLSQPSNVFNPPKKK